MRRVIVLALLVFAAVGSGVGSAQDDPDCGTLDVAQDFSAFAHGGYSAAGVTVQGRLAAGGDVSLRNSGVGGALPSDSARLDLMRTETCSPPAASS